MKIGLIGCGNIGRFLLDSINVKGLIENCRIEAAFDMRQDIFEELSSTYGIQMHADVPSLLKSDVDLIIEAANIQAVQENAVNVLEHGKNMIIISVGALVNHDFYELLQDKCKENGVKIYLPSGAIGGLDVVKAAAAANELHSVAITTRKPPASLGMESLESEQVLFDGPAEEAIARFPQNVNVSIILSLVGLGPKETKIRIIADPNVTKNNHHIEAVGSFGRLTLHVENDPMPSNPKTSYLAALSILSTLKNQSQFIQVG